jgi:PAS domain S-box-containing protein
VEKPSPKEGARIDVGGEPPSVAQSDSDLLEFFDLALDLMVIAGFDGYYKRVNPAYERTLGYPLRELLSRPFLEFIHPEDRPPVRDTFGELVGGDSDDVIGFEHRVICGDGSVRWLEWNSRIMPERGVIFAVGRDVTDRRRADAELREARRMVETSRHELAPLADEQAALRRVATLVARGVRPEEVFAAVSDEVGRLVGTDSATIIRYDDDGPAVVFVGVASTMSDAYPLGARWEFEDGMASAEVYRTGRSARGGGRDWSAVEGPVGETHHRLHIVSTVASPIVVEGRLWGAMAVQSQEPLPLDTDERLEKFTELVATAIANAEGRARLARLAEEQAALRRVATLVAHGAPPEEVFTAVANEVGRLLPVDVANVCRYESDGTFTFVASGSERFPVGSRWPLGGQTNLATLVSETGRPARLDDYGDATGPLAEGMRKGGVRSAVGTPIIVEGRLWGLIAAGSRQEHPLPPDTEARLASFTELVATAIANAEARSEVAASRARIVAATDEERRRVVRDLHDGAQQRLVHTVITLKLAQRSVHGGEQDVPVLVSEALENAEQAMAEVRELAHGILPGALTRGGLRAGVDVLASRMPVPVETDISVGRLPAAVEATAYFVVAEALTNVAKHARARGAEVTARVEHGTVQVQIRDDGVGGALPDGAGGLIGLADRLAALDGELRVDSSAESGTVVAAAIPLQH